MSHLFEKIDQEEHSFTVRWETDHSHPSLSLKSCCTNQVCSSTAAIQPHLAEQTGFLLQLEWNSSFFQVRNRISVKENSKIFVVWSRLTSWTMPHSHFTPSGFCNGWAWYCVFCWLLHNLSCSCFQAPLKSTCFIVSAASSPLTPLTHFTAFWQSKKENTLSILLVLSFSCIKFCYQQAPLECTT